MKMQDFKFNGYIDFFEALSPEHKIITSMLKDLVYEAIPDTKEKLSWNVPFFFKNQTICFIWPGCIPWGKKTFKGVQLGFAKGYKMRPNDFLEQGSRKQISTHTFYSAEEVATNVEVILKLLCEAEELD